MSLSRDKLRQEILAYLEKNRRMTLATSDHNTPWAATVMFAYDKDLNFYIISRPDTRKIKNLEKNPQVSVAVNEFINKKGRISGLQVEGRVRFLDKTKDKDKLDIYRDRHPWADEYLHDHDLYMIIPSKIFYLNDELFGPGGREEMAL